MAAFIEDRYHSPILWKVKRVGLGFRKVAHYRLRLRLAVGRDWRTVH